MPKLIEPAASAGRVAPRLLEVDRILQRVVNTPNGQVGGVQICGAANLPLKLCRRCWVHPKHDLPVYP